MGTHQRGTMVEKLWENCHNPACEGFSRSDFRMSGSKFESIVKLVKRRLEKRDTQIQRPIPIQD